MHNAVKGMLADYACESGDDYLKALREILQEVVLLGLREGGFFDRAAFFGGTALRVLHGLQRSCDSLDFCLRKPDPSFQVMKYADSVAAQLSRFGLSAEMCREGSAGVMVKGVIRKLMQDIGAPDAVVEGFHYRKVIRIPINVDTAPAAAFLTDEKFLQRPVPFPVPAVSLPDAFAMKIHTLLSDRATANGVDWFDFEWFVISCPEVRLDNLEARLRSSGDFCDETAQLTLDRVQTGLLNKVKALDIVKAKQEAAPFVSNPAAFKDWSREYLFELIGDLEAV